MKSGSAAAAGGGTHCCRAAHDQAMADAWCATATEAQVLALPLLGRHCRCRCMPKRLQDVALARRVGAWVYERTLRFPGLVQHNPHLFFQRLRDEAPHCQLGDDALASCLRTHLLLSMFPGLVRLRRLSINAFHDAPLGLAPLGALCASFARTPQHLDFFLNLNGQRTLPESALAGGGDN